MVLILFTLLGFQPAFEVASVKPSPPQAGIINTVLTYPGGRILAKGCWLRYLMMEAFDVQPFQIAGGPSWTSEERFDIDARPPGDSKSILADPPISKLPMNDEQRLMLQALLADRFQLKYHDEEREGTVYFLIRTNKKLRLEPAKDKDAYPWAGSPRGGAFDTTGVAGTNISMHQLAARLSRALEHPVVDRTGIEGTYDFRYEFASDDANQESATSILMSMQALGLKLETGKGPVKSVVIECVETSKN